MAIKLSGESFLQCVRQSSLIEQEAMNRLLQDFRQHGVRVDDSRALAEEFVSRGSLTRWQADKLLQGKHKGFFLGKYRLLSLLGKGGMSSVYLAEHVLMRRRCAIKVLPSKRVNDSSYLGRFHREAQAVAALDHPNIVRAYDVDKESEKETEIHFLVMEYVDGTSLHDLVAKEGVMSFIDAAEYIRQASLGLSHAHHAGMVHRDIKPGNLLVAPDGTVKILDLGLARFFNEEDENSLTVAHDEKVLGTADYLAPEQALDSHRVDARADIYSLGCTMYFLLTGHPPFTEGTLAQRLMAHQTKQPPPIERDRPETPRDLSAIITKMMAKKTDERYQTAEDVADALREWLQENGDEDWHRKHGRGAPTPRRSDPSIPQIQLDAVPSFGRPAETLANGGRFDTATSPAAVAVVTPPRNADSWGAPIPPSPSQMPRYAPAATVATPVAQTAAPVAIPVAPPTPAPEDNGSELAAFLTNLGAAPPAPANQPVAKKPPSSKSKKAAGAPSPKPPSPKPPSSKSVLPAAPVTFPPPMASPVPAAAPIPAAAPVDEDIPDFSQFGRDIEPVAAPAAVPVAAAVPAAPSWPGFDPNASAAPPAAVPMAAPISDVATAYPVAIASPVDVPIAEAIPVAAPVAEAAPAATPGSRVSRGRGRKPSALDRLLADRRVVYGAIGAGTLVVVALIVWSLVGGDDPKPSKGGGTTGGTTASGTGTSGVKGVRDPRGLIGKDITVGGAGAHFPTINEALAYVAEHYTGGRRDVQTIQVAGGQTYAERIRVTKEQADVYPSGIRIVSSGGTRAILAPTGGEPAVSLAGGPEKFTLDGFDITASAPVAIQLEGTLKGLRIKNLQVSGFTQTGLLGKSPVGFGAFDDDVVLEGLTFKGNSASAVGVRLQSASELVHSSQVKIRDCRFLGPLGTGVLFPDDAVEVQVRGCIFSDVDSGVRYEGASRFWKSVVLAHNTFYKVKRPISFAEMPGDLANGLGFFRNLFVEPGGPEAIVEKDFNAAKFLTHVEGANLNGFEGNWSTRAAPAEPEKNLIGDLFHPGRNGKRDPAAAVFNTTDSTKPRFLAPGTNAPQANVANPGKDNFPYIGAVAP